MQASPPITRAARTETVYPDDCDRRPTETNVRFRLRSAWLWPATRPKVLDAIRELGVI